MQRHIHTRQYYIRQLPQVQSVVLLKTFLLRFAIIIIVIIDVYRQTGNDDEDCSSQIKTGMPTFVITKVALLLCQREKRKATSREKRNEGKEEKKKCPSKEERKSVVSPQSHSRASLSLS